MSVSNIFPPNVPDWNTQQDDLQEPAASQTLDPANPKKRRIITAAIIIGLFGLGTAALLQKDYIQAKISAGIASSTPQASFEVAISGTNFLVPGTYLHRLEYGTGANTTKVHLILPWRRRQPGKDPTYILSATLKARDKLTPQTLFQRVFKPLFDGAPTDIGNGIKRYKFKPGTAYSSETLYLWTTTKGTQFARCLTVPGTPGNGHCQASILIAKNVTLSYRFAHGSLTDWPKINTGLTEFINSLKVKPDQRDKKNP